MPYNSGMFQNAGNLRGNPVSSVYQAVCINTFTCPHLDVKRVVSHCNCDLFQNTGNPSRVTRGTVYQVVCVPASCLHQDIKTAVLVYLQKYQHPAGV